MGVLCNAVQDGGKRDNLLVWLRLHALRMDEMLRSQRLACQLSEEIVQELWPAEEAEHHGSPQKEELYTCQPARQVDDSFMQPRYMHLS